MNQGTEQSPRKVLYIVTKSGIGGAQRYVYDLATHLNRQLYEPIVAVGGAGPLIDDLHAAGVRTVSIDGLQRDISAKKEWGAFRSLYRILRTEGPHVVHLNSSKAGVLGALAARLAGTRRIVFTAHGWPFAEPRGPLWRTVAWLGSWFTALLSHTVICVSKADLARASHMPFASKKAKLIHNGIDLNIQLGSGECIRSSFPAGAVITGTIGELNKNKNQQVLIERAARTPLMYVAIVGEGEERESLEALIRKKGVEERVKLFGYIPAREALKGFDRFSLPSLKEGLPYSLLEAKAVGLPLDANRVGGVGEILDKDLSEFSLDKMIEQTVALY